MLILSLICQIAGAQSYTGSWLGVYSQDLHGASRTFYYRIQLVQEIDSVYGICELLDATADLKGFDPSQAEVVSRYWIKNFEAKNDDRIFSFSLGDQINSESLFVAPNRTPPLFFRFNCMVESGDRLYGRRSYLSVTESRTEAVGELVAIKESNVKPDLDQYVSSATLSLGTLINLKKKNRTPKTPKNVMKDSTELAVEIPFDPSLAASSRIQETQGTMIVPVRKVLISLYDNGVVDNDTASVFLNGKLLVESKRLSADALRFEIELDADAENVFLLVAHNLGDIAPNTALMTVTVADVRHEIFLTSTLKKNAAVRFIVKPEVSTN